MTRATIVGFGVVGTSTAAALSRAGVMIDVLDPDKGHDDYEKLKADWVFVCVPTPYDESAPGRCDVSAVWDVLRACDERTSSTTPPAVVIRSTVPPGTTQRAQDAFARLQLVCWPEFLTEATAVRDGLEPSRVLIGYTDRSVVAAAKLLEFGQRAPFVELVPSDVAEMVKYFSNSFYATVVSFTNQMYELCVRLGIDYEMVRRAAEHDPMMARHHLDVHHKGFRGYGGKCLPKDSKALLALAGASEAELSVLAAADRYNDRLTGRKP